MTWACFLYKLCFFFIFGLLEVALYFGFREEEFVLEVHLVAYQAEEVAEASFHPQNLALVQFEVAVLVACFVCVLYVEAVALAEKLVYVGQGLYISKLGFLGEMTGEQFGLVFSVEYRYLDYLNGLIFPKDQSKCHQDCPSS